MRHRRAVLVLAGGVVFVATVAALVVAGTGTGPAPMPRTAVSTPVTVTTVPCAPPASYLATGVPSPCLTPGVARTSDPAVICVPGAATRARAELSSRQWAALRIEVTHRYGLDANPGEIDHFLPIEA